MKINVDYGSLECHPIKS